MVPYNRLVLTISLTVHHYAMVLNLEMWRIYWTGFFFQIHLCICTRVFCFSQKLSDHKGPLDWGYICLRHDADFFWTTSDHFEFVPWDVFCENRQNYHFSDFFGTFLHDSCFDLHQNYAYGRLGLNLHIYIKLYYFEIVSVCYF